MDELDASYQRLEALLAIVGRVHEASAGHPRYVAELTGRLRGLLPFRRGLVLQERDVGSAAADSLACVIGDGPGPTPDACTSGSPIGTDALLAAFDCGPMAGQAFRWTWRDAPPPFTGRAGVLAAHLRGGQGVAARMDTTLPDGRRLASLLVLECDPLDRGAALLAGYAVFHLHAHCAIELARGSLHAAPEREVTLTPKERDVVQWVVQGKTSWEIGRILDLSERTVKFHLKHVYAKLNVCNRAQAVAVVSRLRLF